MSKHAFEKDRLDPIFNGKYGHERHGMNNRLCPYAGPLSSAVTLAIRTARIWASGNAQSCVASGIIPIFTWWEKVTLTESI